MSLAKMKRLVRSHTRIDDLGTAVVKLVADVDPKLLGRAIRTLIQGIDEQLRELRKAGRRTTEQQRRRDMLPLDS